MIGERQLFVKHLLRLTHKEQTTGKEEDKRRKTFFGLTIALDYTSKQIEDTALFNKEYGLLNKTFNELTRRK